MKKLFECKGCGLIFEGDDAPNVCPKCGAPKSAFAEVDAETSKKIYAAERTNTIHIKIAALADEIISLAQEGLEIGLDSGCIGDFEKAKDESWIIKQRSKAELKIHMNKNKY